MMEGQPGVLPLPTGSDPHELGRPHPPKRTALFFLRQGSDIEVRLFSGLPSCGSVLRCCSIRCCTGGAEYGPQPHVLFRSASSANKSSSSLFGEFTRGEIGHMTMWSDGNGASSSMDPARPEPSFVILRLEDRG